jgi:hypothetical protein
MNELELIQTLFHSFWGQEHRCILVGTSGSGQVSQDSVIKVLDHVTCSFEVLSGKAYFWFHWTSFYLSIVLVRILFITIYWTKISYFSLTVGQIPSTPHHVFASHMETYTANWLLLVWIGRTVAEVCKTGKKVSPSHLLYLPQWGDHCAVPTPEYQTQSPLRRCPSPWYSCLLWDYAGA